MSSGNFSTENMQPVNIQHSVNVFLSTPGNLLYLLSHSVLFAREATPICLIQKFLDLANSNKTQGSSLLDCSHGNSQSGYWRKTYEQNVNQSMNVVLIHLVSNEYYSIHTTFVVLFEQELDTFQNVSEWQHALSDICIGN